MKAREGGEIAKIDSTNRLCVPAGVLGSVSWWKSVTVGVIAELVHSGLIRIYVAAEAEPLIENLKAAALELSDGARFERMAVIADRYRPLKLYDGGRLSMTKDVAQILEYAFGERSTLFAQSFVSGFEVMSLRFRADRLANDRTSILLHQDSAD